MILTAIGSNEPFCGAPPEEVVRAGARALDAACGLVAGSRLYCSPAWPDPTDPPYVNAVVAVRWGGDPDRLMVALHRIEAAFGRVRGAPNAPRTLDLDLLAFDDVVRTPQRADGLAIPHPRLAMRDFVLLPLLDVAAQWRCPVSGASVHELLEALPARWARPLGAPPLAPFVG